MSEPLTSPELAEKLGISIQTLSRHFRTGRLSAAPVGKRRVWRGNTYLWKPDTVVLPPEGRERPSLVLECCRLVGASHVAARMRVRLLTVRDWVQGETPSWATEGLVRIRRGALSAVAARKRGEAVEVWPNEDARTVESLVWGTGGAS